MDFRMNTPFAYHHTEMEEKRYFNPQDLFVGAFIPNSVLSRQDLSPAAKLCWAVLAGYTGAIERHCQTLNDLAAAIGLSRRDTVEGIRELKSNGLVQ